MKKNKQRMAEKKDKESIISDQRDAESQHESKLSQNLNRKNNAQKI